MFQSKESDVHPGHYTIGHANIEGATEVTFTLQMCHAVVLLGLLTNSTPGIYTNIQVKLFRKLLVILNPVDHSTSIQGCLADSVLICNHLASHHCLHGCAH